LGIISVDLDAKGLLLIIYSAFVNTWGKGEYNEVDFKKAYDLVRREIFYNILIECGIRMKLVRLIKMCLNETYSRVRVGKNLSDMFPIKNGLKQEDALSSLLFNFALE